MLYEIINPSDPYTIEAHSLDVAFVACCLLGEGKYGFDPLEDGGTKIPMFLFGGHEEWSRKHCGGDTDTVVGRVMEEKRAELADCLDSCLIGKQGERRTYQEGLRLIEDPAKREEWRARWHNQKRSSLNDIGARAYAMAKRLRNNT